MERQPDQRDELEIEDTVSKYDLDEEEHGCQLCLCLRCASYDSYSYRTPTREERYRVFHQECSTCTPSSPDSLNNLCLFCQHLRLRHIFSCANQPLRLLAIKLDPLAKAPNETKCPFCRFVVGSISNWNYGARSLRSCSFAMCTLFVSKYNWINLSTLDGQVIGINVNDIQGVHSTRALGMF